MRQLDWGNDTLNETYFSVATNWSYEDERPDIITDEWDGIFINEEDWI